MSGIGRFLETFRDWRETRRSLRELRALKEAEDREVLGVAGFDPVVSARASLDRGDRADAARHWKEALARFPDHVGRSHDAVRLALSLDLFDEADKLAKAGRRRRPPDPVWFEVCAELAGRRGNIDDAFIQWSQIQKRFAERPLAYVKAAMCLYPLGRQREIEPALERTIQRFPDHPDPRIEYARVAEYLGEWSEALERWNWVEEHCPGYPEGVTGAARVLEELGRPDEAEARLKAARHRHTTNAEIAITLARHAVRHGDWEATAQAWENIRERWPDRPEGYQSGAVALSALGRQAEADQLLAASP